MSDFFAPFFFKFESQPEFMKTVMNHVLCWKMTLLKKRNGVIKMASFLMLCKGNKHASF
jgi:hypothetical protein